MPGKIIKALVRFIALAAFGFVMLVLGMTIRDMFIETRKKI